MMKNTELFYRQAKTFQDKRAAINEQYSKDKQALEPYRGSQGFEDESKQLDEKHTADLAALVNESRPGMLAVLKSMYEAIGSRSMPAPTTEHTNLLNVLRMKSKVTEQDCQRVAEAVKDNPLAVSVVSEIAREHGIVHSYDNLCPEMSTKRAGEILATLKNELEDFLQYDTSRVSRLVQKHDMDFYGQSSNRLTPRATFATQAEFYSTVGLEGENMRKFAEIVDATA